MKNEKPIKKLSLERDTIRGLTPSQLDGVAGGTGGTTTEVCPLTTMMSVSWTIHKLTETKAADE
jgi:hypothetical protein